MDRHTWESVIATDPLYVQTWTPGPWIQIKECDVNYFAKHNTKSPFGLFTYAKKMNAFWKKMAIPGYTIGFSGERENPPPKQLNYLDYIYLDTYFFFTITVEVQSFITTCARKFINIAHCERLSLEKLKMTQIRTKLSSYLLGTTKPPKRIHMEAMRDPKDSMKPMKSHTREPAKRR